MFLTDNRVLVEKLREMPAIMCVQRRAEKKMVTEQDLIEANIASFGDDIGKTTNWITSMFDVQAGFDRDSDEYKILEYRIMCGQLFQQNAIDKAKGIISQPMPREWYDRHAINSIEDEDRRKLYHSICADKKPYFMRYIYPDLMSQYNSYVKNTEKNAMREFGITIEELENMASEDRTPRQNEFLTYYRNRMPVGSNDCVMNKICRRFEKEFGSYLGKKSKETNFDYTILKSDSEYTQTQYNSILKLYKNYNIMLKKAVFAYKYQNTDAYEMSLMKSKMMEDFKRECEIVCPDSKALCNIVLDICYQRSATKRFAWDMCSDEIIENLLKRNDYTMCVPMRDSNGDITYGGDRFSLKYIKLEGCDECNS